jgi:hypothetical protein
VLTEERSRRLLFVTHAIAVDGRAVEPVHRVYRQARADDPGAALELCFAAERHHDQASEHDGAGQHVAQGDHWPGHAFVDAGGALVW